jgi:transcriptional antiterminator NusG
MSSKRWYIVHAYSGFEKQVMRSLQERIQTYRKWSIFLVMS